VFPPLFLPHEPPSLLFRELVASLFPLLPHHIGRNKRNDSESAVYEIFSIHKRIMYVILNLIIRVLLYYFDGYYYDLESRFRLIYIIIFIEPFRSSIIKILRFRVLDLIVLFPPLFLPHEPPSLFFRELVALLFPLLPHHIGQNKRNDSESAVYEIFSIHKHFILKISVFTNYYLIVKSI
jgi:hypothetical protein